jgi:hypothetical protein
MPSIIAIFRYNDCFENKIFLKKGPKVGKYLGIAPEILNRCRDGRRSLGEFEGWSA